MGEKEQDYESRQNEILNFVSKSPNCTKADVIRHMKGRSAVTTTHAILQDLVNERIINVYKKNLQTHLLTINRENEFIWINNTLADVYDFIDKCEKVTEKLIVFRDKNLPDLRKKKEISEKVEFEYMLFLQKFIAPIDAILHRLLNYSILDIKSEKHSQLINKKILHLMKKLYEMPLYIQTKKSKAPLNIDFFYSNRMINSSLEKINSDVRALKRLKSKQNPDMVSEYYKLTEAVEKTAQNFMKGYTRTKPQG